MRTLQEKYNAVLEGTFSKEQFRRDAVMQLPNLVSKFNSFEDMATILKNRGMLAEAKKEEVTAYKKPEVETADLIAPDLLDHGIKAELEAAKIEGTPSEEEYEKAKEKAAENLVKNPLHYKDAQTMPEMGKKKALKEDSQNSFLRAQEKLRDELSDKEMAAAVADEPASLAAAFRKKVMSMADEFRGTPEEVQAKLLAAWEEFKTNYHADKEGEQEFDKYAGAPMDAEIQEAGEPMMIGGKEVDPESLEYEPGFDYDSQDQPIYVIKSAKFVGGTALTDSEIDTLNSEYPQLANPEDVFEGKRAQLKEAVKALIKKTLEA
jgi:hypothetical protein